MPAETEIEAKYLQMKSEDRRMQAEDLQMKMGPEKGPLSSPKRKNRFEISLDEAIEIFVFPLL